ncbi:hypothetical protein SacmaDRAFT_0774 [Saccharomonospora marina XMU15]|uniref:Uncharacterized protein n=1 Tax=Saccharomonospora marina XMU15 TaxID=882083 RepID=H5X7A9_9PSEU|nr:hypothetical protein SacmaDRAFT_0774 [Saccharomonospora marina XMU15]
MWRCVVAEPNETGTRPVRRRVDIVTLLSGVAALLVSAYVLSDGATWLPDVDLRWVLAGGAVLVGTLLLAASMRGGRRE